MKLHFQVVLLDNTDYILGYKNFKWDESEAMMDYIQFKSTDGSVQTIKITRWNEKGERQ